MGHGRGQHRRQIKKTSVTQPVNDTISMTRRNESPAVTTSTTPAEIKTRSGRRVRQLADSVMMTALGSVLLTGGKL